MVSKLKEGIVAIPYAKKSLYDRLGGVITIALIVDDFVDQIKNENSLNLNIQIRNIFKKKPTVRRLLLIIILFFIYCI